MNFNHMPIPSTTEFTNTCMTFNEADCPFDIFCIIADPTSFDFHFSF